MVRILCRSKAPKQPQPRYWTHAHNRAAIAALYRATKPHAKARRSQPTQGADKAPREAFYSNFFSLKHKVKRNGPVTVAPPQFPARPRDLDYLILLLVHS